MSEQFVSSVNDMMTQINDLMKEKGFWSAEAGEDAKKLLLMHSELSEAAEVLRKGDSPYVVSEEHPKLDIDTTDWPVFSKMEMELADTVIRIFDYSKGKNYDLATAILYKHQINSHRPKMHGNKKF